MTRIMFRPNFSYSENYSNGQSSSVTFNDDPYAWGMSDPLSQYRDYVADSIVVNDNRRWNHSDGKSYSVDGMLMVNRRLNSKGRNLTLRMRGRAFRFGKQVVQHIGSELFPPAQA